MNRMKLSSIALFTVSALVAPFFAQGNDRFPVALWDKTGEPKEPTPAAWKGVTHREINKTNYFLPSGFYFSARLELSVYSYNTEGPVIAVVDSRHVPG